MTPKTKTAAPNPALDSFLAAMDRELDAWAKLAAAAGNVGAMDGSYESIDRAEALYGEILDGKVAADAKPNDLSLRLARYAGEVLVRATGARWDISQDGLGRTKYAIKALPHLPRADVQPVRTVKQYEKARVAGTIRDQIEPFDLRRRQAWYSGLKIGDEVDALRDQIQKLARQDLLPLDRSVASVPRVQRALSVLVPKAGTLDELRELKLRVALYLGEVIRKKSGGAWDLCTDPNDLAFGMLQIGGYAPGTLVARFEVDDAPDSFSSAIEGYL